MEKFLQDIVKKFVKTIEPGKISLKEVRTGKAVEDFGSEIPDDVIYHIYQIKYAFLTVGTVVTLVGRNANYLSNIDINPAFRSRGIGGIVLKRYFSGYYIMADNDRAGRLYARMGKAYNKFTKSEFEKFVSVVGMRGVYKLDSLKRRKR